MEDIKNNNLENEEIEMSEVADNENMAMSKDVEETLNKIYEERDILYEQENNCKNEKCINKPLATTEEFIEFNKNMQMIVITDINKFNISFSLFILDIAEYYEKLVEYGKLHIKEQVSNGDSLEYFNNISKYFSINYFCEHISNINKRLLILTSILSVNHSDFNIFESASGIKCIESLYNDVDDFLDFVFFSIKNGDKSLFENANSIYTSADKLGKQMNVTYEDWLLC